jgi:anti-sigma factor RsiW
LYLYDELPAHHEQEFKEHLKTCTHCQTTIILFNDVKESKTVEGLPLNVIMSIFDKTTRCKKAVWWQVSKSLRIGLAVAASIAVGFIVIPSQMSAPEPMGGYYEISPISDSEFENINKAIDEIEALGSYI